MSEPLPEDIQDVDQWEEELNRFDEPDEGPLAGEPAYSEPEPEAPEPEERRGEQRKHTACTHVLDAQAVCTTCGLAFGLDVEGLADATVVSAQGRDIAERGVAWTVEGIVPDYGMVGFLIAYAKVGKTTLSQSMAAAVANGSDFIGHKTRRTRVLYVAAEDPPEYCAYVARHLAPELGWMTFYRRPVILNDDGLARIAATAKAGGYGFVLIASWQSVVRGLLQDENANAATVAVLERVKIATRETGLPWLIDAHSGRNEDQSDDADPVLALRGASGAAGAADFLLSLRYANGAFGNQRRLSGRGRFVNLPPQTISYDLESGTYEDLGSTKDAARETTWRQIHEAGALSSSEPRGAAIIARLAGIVPPEGKVGGQALRRVHEALRGRDGVEVISVRHAGKVATHYRLASAPAKEGGAE